MRNYFPLILVILLFSCNSQKRIANTRQKIEIAQQQVAGENAKINSISDTATVKIQNNEIDSLIKSRYDSVLHQLKKYLQEIDSETKLLEQALQTPSNLKKRRIYRELQQNIEKIDSFNIAANKRERAYELIDEALSMKAYNLFELAAFFGLGKYKIPPDGIGKLNFYFFPILDSILKLSKKYPDVPHRVTTVFVGYSDAVGITENSPLYQNLSSFLGQKPPTKENLNCILSELRAKELKIRMRALTKANSSRLGSYLPNNMDYFGYGRGEAYPSTTIKDYKDNDERRRIVMFYWSVLPELSFP